MIIDADKVEIFYCVKMLFDLEKKTIMMTHQEIAR